MKVLAAAWIVGQAWRLALASFARTNCSTCRAGAPRGRGSRSVGHTEGGGVPSWDQRRPARPLRRRAAEGAFGGSPISNRQTAADDDPSPRPVHSHFPLTPWAQRRAPLGWARTRAVLMAPRQACSSVPSWARDLLGPELGARSNIVEAFDKARQKAEGRAVGLRPLDRMP